MIPTEFPESPGEVYDLLQREFGVGDYDDTHTEEWWKNRRAAVGKVDRVLRARHATFRQIAIAAWYAKEARLAIYGVGQLCGLIPEAMVAYRVAVRHKETADIGEEAARAIQQALAAGDPEWVGRLMRATPGNVRLQLDEWKKTHG